MAKVQIRYLLQILFAIVIAALGFFQMFARIDGGLPSNVLVMMIATAAMFIITWALIGGSASPPVRLFRPWRYWRR